MTGLKKILLLLLMTALLAACKSKKKVPLSGDDLVKPGDFVEFFRTVTLPFQYGDTALLKKDKDSLLISTSSFSHFVPDSVLAAVFGKAAKPKIYAIGRTTGPRKETYLFVKAVNVDKRAFFILNFDGKQQFAAALLALKPDNNKTTIQSVSIDRRFTITKTVTIRNADGSFSDGKDVYSLAADGKSFGLVMTDALSDKITELINPIDTLPRKNKLSADYASSKMNMVSVRDGRRSGQIRFFIHFEKNNGECTGELKGEALMKTPTTAEYREEGDPCILKFIFSSTSVTLKEEEGCGSRRGLRCSFDGSFARKKYSKPADTEKPVTKSIKPSQKRG